MKKPITTPSEAAALIEDGMTLGLCGSGGGLLEADAVFAAIEARFLETGHPRDLTVINGLGLGDAERKRGFNHFAHEGLVKRVICGLWSWSPRMQALVAENKVEAYCFPGGAIQQLMRETGAGRPGLFTHVGLGTFVDPENDGGRCNDITTEELVERIEIDGKPYLRYKPFKIDIGIVRGTSADSVGNISTLQEASDGDAYVVALAAHNSGGKVIAQVRETVSRGAIPPRGVTVPGILVDVIAVDPNQMQTHRSFHEPALCGEERSPEPFPKTGRPFSVRQVIARRAAEELTPNTVVNFGFGIPGGIAAMIAERGESEDYWMTIEQGIHNGAIIDGPIFGAAVNPEVIVSSVQQFDFYSGGGIDTTCLGMGEMDSHGNVNVSHLGGKLVGTGGFIDISQNASKVVFCGTFDAKGGKLEMTDTGVRVTQNGAIHKLVKDVARITFSGPEALRRGQEVVYVTERAVFQLTPDGVELVEIADGIDLDRDILGCMDFKPIVRDPKPMNASLFIRS